jgi:hypothetical protein
MGNILSYTPIIIIKKPDRQVLTPNYIRRLVDNHYTNTYNYSHFTSLYSITLFIQRNYSNKITVAMVKEAMELEPPYTFQPLYGKLGFRYLVRK